MFTGTVRVASPPRARAGGSGPVSRVFTIDVDERLKGEVRDRQRVRTPADSAACGVDLAPGARVLVLAAAAPGPVEPRRGEVSSTSCSGTRTLDGPVPHEVRAAAAGPVVDCAAAIDTVDTIDGLPPGYRTIAVAQDRRGRVAMEWGSARPASALRVEECVAAGGAPWLVFAGGFLVDRPTCVRLTVTGTGPGSGSGSGSERVRVPVGRSCPSA